MGVTGPKNKLAEPFLYTIHMERHMHMQLKQHARHLGKQYGFHVSVSDLVRKVIQNYLDAVNG